MIVSPLSDVQVYEEEDAMFECEVSREAKSFRWLKEAEELTASEKYEMLHEGTKHTLVVKSITKEDLVKYVFEAEGLISFGRIVSKGNINPSCLSLTQL